MISQYPFAAVLFDMDGVVIDNTPLHELVWLEFARSHGFNPSEADIRATNGRRAVDVVISLFGSSLDSDDVVSRLVAEREVLYRQYLTMRNIKAVSGVKSFLLELGSLDVPRVLATSASFHNVTIVLNRLELSACFNAIVSAENVCNGKPDPEVYLTAAKRVEVNPADCLVVEDAVPGMQAAKAAGASCLGITTSQSEDSLKQAGADWVASDFFRLPKPLQVHSHW